MKITSKKKKKKKEILQGLVIGKKKKGSTEKFGIKAKGQEFQLPNFLSSLPQAQLHKHSLFFCFITLTNLAFG